MKKDDFRYMRRGQSLATLTSADLEYMKPVSIQSKARDRALLVLHGFSSSPAVYRYLLPQIKGYDAIVCPVLPGHAQSIDAFSESKAAQWLEAAKNACEPLVSNYSQVDVLGLSLGGLLATELSHSYPIHHLYLLAPALKLKFNLSTTLLLARFLHALGFRQLRNGAGNIRSDDFAEIAYRKLPIPAIIEMLNLAKNYQWTPPTCPVDLFLGRFDEVVDSEAVEALFKPLPQAKIHWLENSAHVLPLDSDLSQIVACISP